MAELLISRDPSVRLMAVKVLGGLGRNAAKYAAHLAQLLGDRNEQVRFVTVWALFWCCVAGRGNAVTGRTDGRPLGVLAE